MKKAILLVSFGTSHQDTREKTLDVLLREMQETFPDYEVYRAWTSKMILRKLRQRDGLIIFNVEEAMEAMVGDGVQELIVQPTHFINGIENDSMKETVMKYTDRIPVIRFGDALLTTTEDNERAIREAIGGVELEEGEALVWMGHGTSHHSNNVYAALDYMMQDLGYTRSFLGTVEAYPSLENLMDQVKASGCHKVVLAPFMMVAGDHAKNDMSGEEPDSWRCRFEAAGFTVRCLIRGLGENPGIRRMFLDHTKACMQED